MMNEKTKNSSFATLAILVLKDIRLERGIPQGHLAQHAGKSPSAWTKIENGHSPLNMDALFGACSALQMQPSVVLGLVERLVPLFNACHWYFLTYALDEADDDQLLKLIIQYFNSAGFEALKSRFGRINVSDLNNVFRHNETPTVVRYCCEPKFREWMDQGAPLAPMGDIPMPPPQEGAI